MNPLSDGGTEPKVMTGGYEPSGSCATDEPPVAAPAEPAWAASKLGSEWAKTGQVYQYSPWGKRGLPLGLASMKDEAAWCGAL